VVERTQALISEDPGQSLRKLVSIVGVSEPMCRIAEEDFRYKSYTLKIRQILSGTGEHIASADDHNTIIFLIIFVLFFVI